MEPEDNSLSLVYRDKESLRSIFFPPILIVFFLFNGKPLSLFAIYNLALLKLVAGL